MGPRTTGLAIAIDLGLMWTIDHEFVRGGRSKRGNASRNMLFIPDWQASVQILDNRLRKRQENCEAVHRRLRSSCQEFRDYPPKAFLARENPKVHCESYWPYAMMRRLKAELL